jgi:hypothetical protein
MCTLFFIVTSTWLINFIMDSITADSPGETQWPAPRETISRRSRQFVLFHYA